MRVVVQRVSEAAVAIGGAGNTHLGLATEQHDANTVDSAADRRPPPQGPAELAEWLTQACAPR
jgi:hypothetical protein